MKGLKARSGASIHTTDEYIESIHAILGAPELAAIATVADGRSHVHTAYFVCSDSLDVYFISQPSDEHTKNLQSNPSASVAVWMPSVTWGENLQGIQLFGTCEELKPSIELAKAMKLFIDKFDAFSTIVKHPGEFRDDITSRMYAVRARSLKLLDEPRFGRRNYIVLDVL